MRMSRSSVPTDRVSGRRWRIPLTTAALHGRRLAVSAWRAGRSAIRAVKVGAELLADYDVLKGRIWVLVLVTTAIALYLAARARGLFPPHLRS